MSGSGKPRRRRSVETLGQRRVSYEAAMIKGKSPSREMIASPRVRSHVVSGSQELRTVHFLVAVVFSVQAFFYVILSNDYSYNLNYVTFTSTGDLVVDPFCSVRLSNIVASYFAIAALHHVLVCIPGVFSLYKAALEKKVNPFRWLEYMVTASLMVVVMALILGIQDVVIVVQLAVLMASCNGLGFAFECVQPSKLNGFFHLLGWFPFCTVFAVLYVKFGEASYDPVVGGFIKPFFYSMFGLFNLFGLNQLLHNIGFYRSYVNVEYTYTVLSVVAKSTMGAFAFVGILYI